VGQDGILRPIGNRPSCSEVQHGSADCQSAAGFHPARNQPRLLDTWARTTATTTSPVPCVSLTARLRAVFPGQAILVETKNVSPLHLRVPAGPSPSLCPREIEASRDATFATSTRGWLNRETETAAVQHGGEAVERRIAGLGEHAIKVFPVQMGIAR
jgi:hypothetical protein